VARAIDVACLGAPSLQEADQIAKVLLLVAHGDSCGLLQVSRKRCRHAHTIAMAFLREAEDFLARLPSITLDGMDPLFLQGDPALAKSHFTEMYPNKVCSSISLLSPVDCRRLNFILNYVPSILIMVLDFLESGILVDLMSQHLCVLLWCWHWVNHV
jgi:hypothetical protein